MALTAFNRKNSDVKRRATGKIAAFAAFIRKNGGVNGVELEK